MKKVHHLTSLIAVSGLALASLPYGSANAGLTHHWTFDEGSGTNAVDSAGGNDASLLNGALWGASGAGALGSSSYLLLDGSNDLADPSLVLPLWSSSNAETWTAWVNDGGGNNNDLIIGNRLDAGSPYPNGSSRLFTKMTIAGTSGRFVYNDGNATVTEFSTETPGYTGDFPDGTWVHFAAVRAGTNFSFYIDGNLVNSTPMSIAAVDMPTAAMPFFMGGEPGTPATEHFTGGIDDVRIYDHALTSGEVAALVPEPSSVALLGLGSLALLLRRRR